MKKFRILPLLLALLLLAALPASAADSETGSVTVTLRSSSKVPRPDTEILLYHVGSVADGYNLSFKPLKPFLGISLDHPEDDSLPRTLLARAKEEEVAPLLLTTGQDGKACFRELSEGLYLVCQGAPQKGYYDIVPFLVSVPMATHEGLVYDIEAAPKVAPEPEATKPVTPGGGSGGGGKPPLIQTGQLKWPVPVLAVSGILLFSLGWAMTFLRDKRR